MHRLKQKILNIWDMWIYRHAFHSLRRICQSTPGFAIVLERHIQDSIKETNIGAVSKAAADLFYETQIKQKSK